MNWRSRIRKTGTKDTYASTGVRVRLQNAPAHNGRLDLLDRETIVHSFLVGVMTDHVTSTLYRFGYPFIGPSLDRTMRNGF
jgi:hypothetical protein